MLTRDNREVESESDKSESEEIAYPVEGGGPWL
jgi:hypothetical protein